MRVAVIVAVSFFALIIGSHACTSDCTGGAGESCLYCSQPCGLCTAVGVVEHCVEVGVVHMSFDDGPNQFSGQVLDLLKSRGVLASFWLIGENIAGLEPVVNRMVSEGHFVGDHTWNHPSLNEIPLSEVESQLTQCKQTIEATVPGYTVTHMRPPYGDLNTPVRQTAQSLGLTPTMWNLDTEDWTDNTQWEQGNVTGTLGGYSRAAHSFVVLSHPNDPTAFGNLHWVLDQVVAAGYKFVSFPECVNGTQRAAHHSAGRRSHAAPPPPECVHGVWDGAYDILCGANNQVSCAQNDDGVSTCCSSAGYCGSSEAYCGAGCQDGPCDTCVAGGYVPFH